MAKIDAYFRSMERFAATGAVLASGQSVVLRFASGDRQATQVTPHDLLVAMAREVAPPQALAAMDGNRPARFEVESNGVRYSLGVTPKPGSWQVVIEVPPNSRRPADVPSEGGSAAAPATAVPSTTLPPSWTSDDGTSAFAGGKNLAIERGQYDELSDPIAATGGAATSGSPLLDQLIEVARTARATDIFLGSGKAPLMRVAGELSAMGDRGELSGDALSRELGIVAPAAARGAWSQRGTATFAYGDGVGRVRVTLTSDHRGPGAALRLLVAEPVPMDRLGVPDQVADWIGRRGLVFVAGASGAGKTTTVAALVHALAEARRRVASFEVAIEIAHANPVVSQRRVGEDVDSVSSGVASAMMEGVDAIVVDAITSSDSAGAIVDAVAGGHLVVAAIPSSAAEAEAHFIERVAPERRGLARTVLDLRLLGVVGVTTAASRRLFELVPGRAR